MRREKTKERGKVDNQAVEEMDEKIEVQKERERHTRM